VATPKQLGSRAIAKEIDVGLVGWIWILAVLAALYFLIRTIFFDDAWWPVIVSVALAWVFYKVSLYYLLQRNGLPSAANTKAGSSLQKNHPSQQEVAAFGTANPASGGATSESAIRIQAANSLEGIPKEYGVLGAMFGTQNQDWKLIERSLIHANDGRKLEKFIISVSGKRKEVYFDITEWFNGNTSKEVKTRLEKIISSHDKPLTVLLPKEEFMTLQTGLLRLTEAQLNRLGLSLTDRKSMLDPFLDAIKPWHGKEYAKIPEHLGVTTLISVWSKIMGLLASWQSADLLQEEELENLKAIIGGTMKGGLG